MKTCQIGMSYAVTSERCDRPGEWQLILPDRGDARGPMCLTHLCDVLRMMPAGMVLSVGRVAEVTSTMETAMAEVKQRIGWVEP